MFRFGRSFVFGDSLVEVPLHFQSNILNLNFQLTATSKWGAGAISTTFWCRLCTEQSLSYRWTTLPAWSPRSCTSIWRGRSMNFSMNMAPLPKAALASEVARWKFSSTSWNRKSKKSVKIRKRYARTIKIRTVNNLRNLPSTSEAGQRGEMWVVTLILSP